MKRLLWLIVASACAVLTSSAAPSASIVTINNAWTDRITEVDGTVWRRGSNFDAAASNLVCFSEVIFAPGLQMDYRWESSTQVHDGSGDWSVSNFDQSEYKYITVIEGETNETTNGTFDFDSEFPFRTDNRYERAKFDINLSGSFGIPSGVLVLPIQWEHRGSNSHERCALSVWDSAGDGRVSHIKEVSAIHAMWRQRI